MRRLLAVVLLLLVIGVVAFFLLGGDADVFFDADVNPPNVDVDPGELPDVDVSPAEEATAGDES